ncbi:MAG: protease [Bacteroidetes bacterium]|nr:MAG: protease [Bacteroidota bacterium]
MKRFYIIFTSILFAFIVNSSAVFSQNQQVDRLFRFPAIHNDTIVFTYAGDLYMVSKTGGEARKLTSGNGYEMFARFSPNGKTIAFTGQYDGNTEVFTIPSTGGVPKRITYTATLNRDDISDRMGPNNIVMDWTPDGKEIVYRSRKQSYNSFVGSLFKVSKDGGMSEQLPLPTGGFCSYSPNFEKLAFNQVMREFRTWKYYHGGMADDVWIYNFKTKETENITNNDAQDIFPMWYKTRVFFLSDRDRIMNLFSYDLMTKQIQKLTQFTEYDIKFPSIGTSNIVFENAGYIYTYEIDKQKLTKIDIIINNDFPESRSKLVDASKYINSYSLSPKAKRLAVSARGDIFTLAVKEGVTYNFTETSNAFDRNVEWSPDGKHIAFLSDREGEYDIYMMNSDGKGPIEKLTTGNASYKFEIQWSPDSKKVLWSDKKMYLQYVDIETKIVTTVTHSPTWEIRDFTWSPDSRWIAYSDNDGKGMNQIYVFDTEAKSTKTVTDKWYSSESPSFSDNGKYLFFSSARTFDPIYSETEWNSAYHDMSKIYFITLQEDEINPFAPKDDNDDIEENKEDKDKKVNVIIDFENIENRVIALPVAAGYYWNIRVPNNKVYYSYYGSSKKSSSIKMYDLNKKKETSLADGMGFFITPDAKKMFINKGKKMQVIDLPSSAIKIDKPIDISGLKVWVNKHEEWAQIYKEAWRQMRDFFYDENMHGVDWNAMYDKYAVLVPYVNNRNDLNYLIGELIGELSIGHAYTGGGDRASPERYKTGLLGAQLSKDESGFFKIDKILKGENFRSILRSPLTEVGLNVAEGNFIISVDGKSCKDYADFYQLMFNKANKTVSLEVNTTASDMGAKTIIIKPIADESKLYYYNWVEDNIAKVNKATEGQVGYIHIPDMGRDGLNEFVKHFYPQLSKKALIIDDRGNGGGNVSPMIIERLRRQITRANIARNQTIVTQTPTKMMLGPVILLVNGYSASDGDLFPYSFRKHKLGKIIGKRTWGGVTGIRGSLPFIDGGNLTRPEFASFAADGSKWIIEGYGVDPDIEVNNDPAREFVGIDQQLNRAIEEIMLELKDYKGLPEPPPYPDKSK